MPLPPLSRVIAVAALQGIGAAKALQRVVAAVAHQLVDAVVAPQGIRMGGAGEIFDPVELVALSVAAARSIG